MLSKRFWEVIDGGDTASFCIQSINKNTNKNKKYDSKQTPLTFSNLFFPVELGFFMSAYFFFEKERKGISNPIRITILLDP